VGDGYPDQDHAQPGPVAGSTSDTKGWERSMPASRSVVSTLLRELGAFSLHPQGRPSPGHRPHRSAQPAPTRRPDRHVVLARPGATSGRHTTGAGTTAVNDGRSSSQVGRPIQETMLVGQPPRFSLARRKPRVQIPSPPPPAQTSTRPGCLAFWALRMGDENAILCGFQPRMHCSPLTNIGSSVERTAKLHPLCKRVRMSAVAVIHY
jgi:hypothetical protein